MPDKKYILVSMEDERAKKIADVLGNKTCKKIIDLLSEKDFSEKDLADKLGIPINTAEYNLKKLLDAELIEKTKNFLWSQKGKKIDFYRLSNKSIIISPKKRIGSQIKSILAITALTGIAALVIQRLTNVQNYSKTAAPTALMQSSIESAKGAVSNSANFFLSSIQPGVWFFIGACFAVILFFLLNFRKINERR